MNYRHSKFDRDAYTKYVREMEIDWESIIANDKKNLNKQRPLATKKQIPLYILMNLFALAMIIMAIEMRINIFITAYGIFMWILLFAVSIAMIKEPFQYEKDLKEAQEKQKKSQMEDYDSWNTL